VSDTTEAEQRYVAGKIKSKTKNCTVILK